MGMCICVTVCVCESVCVVELDVYRDKLLSCLNKLLMFWQVFGRVGAMWLSFHWVVCL